MKDVKSLVLRAAGINCDLETGYALEMAGASSEAVHINRLIEEPGLLEEFQILVFPGGFSYGDDVAAGKILANQVIHHLYGALEKFVDSGKLVLGICNGFQVLVKAGLLPGGELSRPRQRVTITHNDCGKFEDRWVYLSPQSEKCVFITPGQQIYLPIAHGEGKVFTSEESVLAKLESEGQIAFKYVDEDGNEGDFPVNPNGSVASIAGLTDETGRVMGLMPHPERFVRVTQHPRWSRDRENINSDGMTIFNNAVEYVKANL